MVNEKLWNTSVIYNKSGGFCIFPCSRLILYVGKVQNAEFSGNGYFYCFRPQTPFRANLEQNLKTV